MSDNVQKTYGSNLFESGESIFINLTQEQVEPHLHTHDFLEIAYVYSGEGIHVLGNRKFDVSKGDLFIINYNVEHEFRPHEKSRNKLAIFNCVFNPEFLDYTLINSNDFKDIAHHFLFNSLFPQEKKPISDIRFEGKELEEIDTLYIKMHNEYLNKKDGYTEMLRAYLIQLLVAIFRAYKSSSVTKKQQQLEYSKRKLVEDAMRYMKENYKKDIKLEELSMISFFSRNYFCKLFKDATGMTVVEYIQKIRIQNACRLLEDTSESVANISCMVGYEDTKFFTELFKRYTGQTPGAYRKDIK